MQTLSTGQNAVASCLPPPKKKKVPLYLFEAFDEQKKAGDGGAGAIGSAVENNWGVFTEAGRAKYEIPALMN